MPAIRAAFAAAYAARYTSVYGGVGVQAVSLRVRCRGPLPALTIAQAGESASGPARKGTRPAWFGDRLQSRRRSMTATRCPATR